MPGVSPGLTAMSRALDHGSGERLRAVSARCDGGRRVSVEGQSCCLVWENACSLRMWCRDEVAGDLQKDTWPGLGGRGPAASRLCGFRHEEEGKPMGGHANRLRRRHGRRLQPQQAGVVLEGPTMCPSTAMNLDGRRLMMPSRQAKQAAREKAAAGKPPINSSTSTGTRGARRGQVPEATKAHSPTTRRRGTRSSYRRSSRMKAPSPQAARSMARGRSSS